MLRAVFGREVILGEQRVDAIFDRCAQCGKGHASAGKLTVVTQGSRGQPNSGEAADTKKSGEAVGVELIGFVDVAHHELCLGGVCQQRETTCCFDLVCDPVPIADALQSDRSSTWKSGEKGGNGSRGVIDSNSIEHLATGVLEFKLGIVFVSITADGNCLHDIPPRGAQSPTSNSSAQGGAVILSSR